ncbi:MAG: phosphotransferase enzyme family protein [Cyanophyceae cyanobacterium]
MELLNVITKQYNLKLEKVELLQDTDDLVYKITDSYQQYYSAKIQRKQLNRTNDKLLDLCNWLSFLSKAVSFKFPIPLRNVDRSYQSQIQNENGTRHNFVVYRWVDGEPISKQMNKQNNQRIGALMAELHHASSRYHRKAPALARYDEKWLRSCLSIILNGAKSVGYTTQQLNKVKHGLRAIEEYLASVGNETSNFGIIHSDLHFNNILIDSAGSLAVIDFDEAGFGHYWLDIAVTLDEFHDYSEADTMIEQFIDGYRTVRDIEFDSTTIKLFRGLSATLYASWVFSPENEWVIATKLDYGKDALEQIQQIV